MKTSALVVPVVAAFLLLSGVDRNLGAAENAASSSRKIRLAVAGFASLTEDQSTRDQSALLVDLLTSQLSASPEFELVERAQIEQALKEAALSLGQMNKPADAIKSGKLLRADWLLIGSFVRLGGTNSVLAKIVDAQAGIVRDLTSTPLLSTNLLATAQSLAAFVASSRTSVRGLGDRVFLAIGGFEDLGLHSRYPEFGNQLRASMARHYQGTRVSVVERSQVNPLLNELRLSLAGLMETHAQGSSAQPAFVLVDGLYQSFQDERSKINLVLRIEPLGAGIQTQSLKEPPGIPLETKIAETIDRAIRALRTGTNVPTRSVEATAQLKRGKQLARLGDKFHIGPVTGLIPIESLRKERVAIITEAISALESALLLDPDSIEAKFSLAVCLADPHIEKREQARDYWREVAAASTNAELVRLTRTAIAGSYEEEDDLQAIELFLALKRESADLQQTVGYNARLRRIYDRLGRQNRIPAEALISFMTEAWRADCQNALRRAEQDSWMDVYQTFEVRGSDFYPAFQNDSDAQRRYVSAVVTNLIAEFPRLAPYLIAGHVRNFGKIMRPELRAWYEQALAQCRTNPDSILVPARFYSSSLWVDLTRFLGWEHYDLAENTATLLNNMGRKYLIRSTQDELDLYLGFFHFRKERWREALEAFERIGDREVVPVMEGREGPWGKGRIASARVAADACRAKLGLTNQPQVVASIPSPRPIKVLPGTEIVLKVDGARIWLADETGLFEFNPGLSDLRRIPLRLPLASGVSSIAVARGKVWLGTRSDGVFVVDAATHAATNYGVTDGLLMPGVTSLLATDDRVWMGFGERKAMSGRGGIGFFNLPDGPFVGLMPELPANLTNPPIRSAFSSSLNRGGPAPRAYVIGFSRSRSGQLWAATSGSLLRYTDAKSNLWEYIALDCRGPRSNVAAGERYVVLPSYEPSGWSSETTQFGGLCIYDVQRQQSRRLSKADGLPSNAMRSAAMDGDKAWIGGDGFVAVVDLPSARVDRVCKLFSSFRVRSLEIAGNDVWFTSGPGLYRLSKEVN